MRWKTLALVLVVVGCGSTTKDKPTGVGQDKDNTTGSSSSSGGGGGVDGGDGGGGGGGDAGKDSGSSACATPCTGANITCDPADGKCKLDGTTTNVGGKCKVSGADPACGTAANATCNDEVADGFPGGYCSYEPCTKTALCPIGATCAHLGAESDACYKNCNSDADCRSPDYGCFPVDPLITSGASKKVCYLKDFACLKASDCPAILPKCVGGDGGATGICSK